MLFLKIKRCNDDRVIKAGLDTIIDYKKGLGLKVKAFACCFKKDTLIFSFGYEFPYRQSIQANMAAQFIKKLPQEEKYSKVEYYSSEKFESECSKYCKGLWLTADYSESRGIQARKVDSYC